MRKPRLALAAVLSFAALLALASVAAGPGRSLAEAPVLPHRLFVPGVASSASWSVSVLADPDEAAFDRNDIGRVTVSANGDVVHVRVETAEGQDFRFGPRTGVLVRFTWLAGGKTSGEADYVQVFAFGPTADVLHLDTEFGGRLTHGTTPATIAGDALEFSVPRAFFRRTDHANVVVYGIDPANTPGCEVSCVNPRQDGVPLDDDSQSPEDIRPAVILLP